jgi:hypothetical protein
VGQTLTASTKSFIRHYVEMVVAMFAGMIVLGMPAEGLMRVAGTSSSEVQADAPALMLLGMAFIMTVPMVGWMIHRGHGRRANAEMSASMFLPTFGVIGLLAGGIVTDFGALMGIEHAVMLPSMLAAMLLRPHEYRSCHTHGREVLA